MFQVIHNRIYFVVELKEVPQRPISDAGDPALTPYAEALSAAIKDGIVSQPGKYAIAVNTSINHWSIFEIKE